MVDNPVGLHVVRTSIAFGVIDAIAVSLRIVARWRSKAAFAADDALIVASLAPLFAMIIIGHLSQSDTPSLHFLLADLNRCGSGKIGAFYSHKSRPRTWTWTVSNLSVAEAHDVRHCNRMTLRKRTLRFQTLTTLL